jgi:hypothetical protein
VTERVLLWHYTVGGHLVDIIRDGLIKPTSVMIDAKERAAVWFSSNSAWERTAGKSLLLGNGKIRMIDTIDELHKYAKVVRIAVERTSAPVNWYRFKRESRISPKSAARLEKAGIDAGADPSEWFCSFQAVPSVEWRAVDEWDGSKWCAVDPKSFVDDRE